MQSPIPIDCATLVCALNRFLFCARREPKLNAHELSTGCSIYTVIIMIKLPIRNGESDITRLCCIYRFLIGFRTKIYTLYVWCYYTGKLRVHAIISSPFAAYNLRPYTACLPYGNALKTRVKFLSKYFRHCVDAYFGKSYNINIRISNCIHSTDFFQ